MARKVINRKDLRRESDAAEKAGVGAEGKEKKATVKKAPVKRKSRAKTAKEVRLKAFWGVFNQSMKRVALFEYAEKKLAEKKVDELNASQKSPHFLQTVKEAIAEE